MSQAFGIDDTHRAYVPEVNTCNVQIVQGAEFHMIVVGVLTSSPYIIAGTLRPNIVEDGWIFTGCTRERDQRANPLIDET